MRYLLTTYAEPCARPRALRKRRGMDRGQRPRRCRLSIPSCTLSSPFLTLSSTHSHSLARSYPRSRRATKNTPSPKPTTSVLSLPPSFPSLTLFSNPKALIYPGLSLGTIISRATHLSDKMMSEGIKALAEMAPALKSGDNKDALLPGLEVSCLAHSKSLILMYGASQDLRHVSATVALAVANAVRLLPFPFSLPAAHPRYFIGTTREALYAGAYGRLHPRGHQEGAMASG